jgi:putative ATPase
MSRERTGSLFHDPDEPAEPARIAPDAPLAERMRPRTLEEFVGQSTLVGEKSLLGSALRGGATFSSLILWGPPGSGKTTLARLIAARKAANFIGLSAILAGVKDVRAAIEEARKNLKRSRRTILFIDEIHRFNKGQQDALLGAVEDGTITLIGATTENPSFEVNSALLSRCRVVILEPLTAEDIATIVNRALTDRERGLGSSIPRVEPSLVEKLARWSGGDARVALTAMEEAVAATPPDSHGQRQLTEPVLIEALGRARFAYDRQGEDHYNLISALIKSVRNSDASAALYWLARMIEGGADPIFIARRLCIIASEDVGIADPQAIVQAAAAAQITHLIGLPEALFPLAQATIYLAQAPKSNRVMKAYAAAAADAIESAREPVPFHLRNAVTSLVKAAGYGEGYRYIHDDPAAQREMPCLPEQFQGRDYLAEKSSPKRDYEGRSKQ